MREHARLQFANSKIIHSKVCAISVYCIVHSLSYKSGCLISVVVQDDLELLSVSGSPFTQACKRSGAKVRLDSENHTEEALKELYQHVTDYMPNSAKKKKLIRQVLYHVL